MEVVLGIKLLEIILVIVADDALLAGRIVFVSDFVGFRLAASSVAWGLALSEPKLCRFFGASPLTILGWRTFTCGTRFLLSFLPLAVRSLTLKSKSLSRSLSLGLT